MKPACLSFFLSLLCPVFGEFGPFVEPQTPFLRSALVTEEGKEVNRTRRGVLVPMGEGVWGCFDPDLLRWALFWKVPEGEPPITMDSMAAISYPDQKAKAGRPPKPVGKPLMHSPELPGVSSGARPSPDPRTRHLVGRDDPVGPLPRNFGRWMGISLSGSTPVLHYTAGGREVSEIVRFEKGSIDRLIQVGPGRGELCFRLEADVAGADGPTRGVLRKGSLPVVQIAGEGVRLSAGREIGTCLIVGPSEEAQTARVVRSRQAVDLAEVEFPTLQVARPMFPEAIEVEASASRADGPFDLRPISIPMENVQRRGIRPMDLAFLSDGTALLCGFDGDIWRISGIDQPVARWMRVATGLFEPTNIEVNVDDEVFVLGRDQITQLVDTDGDGHYDVFRNRSDAFEQTLHTRDYAMSMDLGPGGSFYVAKGGIVEMGNGAFNEQSLHRSSVLRIDPSGDRAEVLADGLRLPYVGVRSDGSVFASDQQGHHVPSTPLYRIGFDNPSFGYDPGRFEKSKPIVEPLLWFPYQVNRSGAGFATLSGRGFPDMDGVFAQVSWNGRLFPVETPEVGVPFGWNLPVQFSFPTLNGASHPETGELFVVGLGISGYKPTTPGLEGIAGLRQRDPVAVPSSLEVAETAIRVGFRKPMREDRLPTVASLRFWNIQRTGKYGSGHFRWDGKAGEHELTPQAVRLSDDRRFLTIEVPPVFRSDIMSLTLQLMETGSAKVRTIDLYARPIHLPKPDGGDLAAIVKRERTDAKLQPGDAGRGKEVFARYGCVGCHSLTGEKLTGPALNGIASRQADGLDGYLRESILDPSKQVTEGFEPAMPSFEGVIRPQELEDLVAYLTELK
ncbi:cytochrome c [Haloferula helveola]|uniref:cytochrome c n=1 Tax=Haloferula helveola TaxID=490095 RepID=UPI0030D41291